MTARILSASTNQEVVEKFKKLIKTLSGRESETFCTDDNELFLISYPTDAERDCGVTSWCRQLMITESEHNFYIDSAQHKFFTQPVDEHQIKLLPF